LVWRRLAGHFLGCSGNSPKCVVCVVCYMCSNSMNSMCIMCGVFMSFSLQSYRM
jgi:hypothetical protein